MSAAAESWTLQRMLQWLTEDLSARGITSARLDAELLLAHALGIGRVRVYTDFERLLSATELEQVRLLVKRRRTFEPVAYILGRKEFYGRDFLVNSNVLVPRPDTETLVQAVLDLVKADDALQVLDIGTGSGAIALTLTLEREAWRVDASDVSEAALEVARRNSEALKVGERARFFHSDLFEALPAQRYQVIVSNPPYVPEEDRDSLSKDILDHEPHGALFAGEDGLAVHRRIIEQAPSHLSEGGRLFLEIGHGQGAVLRDLVQQQDGLEFEKLAVDLGGIERVLVARAQSGQT